MEVSVTVHVIVSKVASVIDQDLNRRQSKFLIETTLRSLSRSQVTGLAATQGIREGAFQGLCWFSECNILPHVRESGFWNLEIFTSGLRNPRLWNPTYSSKNPESHKK